LNSRPFPKQPKQPKTKERFPTISGMEGRIKLYCKESKKRPSGGEQTIDILFKRVNPSSGTTSSSSSSSSSSSNSVMLNGSANVSRGTSSSSSNGQGGKAKSGNIHSSKIAQTISKIAPLQRKMR
jgi:hypothetical protein